MRTKAVEKKGFTLIELMIVVAIIGVLAAVAVPAFSDMLEKSREGATRGNISAIMGAIRIYISNYTNVPPDSLTDQSFRAYLDPIPAVKVTCPHGQFRLSGKSNEVEISRSLPGQAKGKAVGLSAFKNDTDGWRYDPESGNVWVNNGQKDTRGIDYTFYGYR
ncbi:MAG TPA: prepilin-type N-terminal cleavage/methylation domain-containing protein [bacterium]|nr:prepilin-type N-terminal cleavage/methylation domain-containing protein [bacterium]